MVTAAVGDDLPEDGDRVMCFACGKFAIFANNSRGSLRKPTKHELRAISSDPDCRQMAMLWAIHS